MSRNLPGPWPQSRARAVQASGFSVATSMPAGMASGKRIAGKIGGVQPSRWRSGLDQVEMSNDESEPRGPWEFSPGLKKPLDFLYSE